MRWWFYASPRRRDNPAPDFVFDFTDFNGDEVEKLGIATRIDLPTEQRIERIQEITCRQEVTRWLKQQLQEPDDEFLAHLTRELDDGRPEEGRLATYKRVVPRALAHVMLRLVEETQTAAMNEHDGPEPTADPLLDAMLELAADGLWEIPHPALPGTAETHLQPARPGPTPQTARRGR